MAHALTRVGATKRRKYWRVPMRWDDLVDRGVTTNDESFLMERIARKAWPDGEIVFETYEHLRTLLRWKHSAEQLRKRALPKFVDLGEITVETEQGSLGALSAFSK